MNDDRGAVLIEKCRHLPAGHRDTGGEELRPRNPVRGGVEIPKVAVIRPVRVAKAVRDLIEDVLSRAGISYRKTKRAERLDGFDQAPDFVVPNEFNPRVVIEAKLTENDGTARDKVARVQHLGALSMASQPPDRPRFEVVGCIAGHGFGVRREDLKKLLVATRGKVFTLQNMS